MRYRLMLLAFACLIVVVTVRRSTAQNQHRSEADAFRIESWIEQFAAPVDIKQWSKANPFPHSGYFNGDNTDCAENWVVKLGPLGVRARTHDMEWQGEKYSAFEALVPEYLKQDGKLATNAAEVLTVDAGSPADGHLQPGDLIVSIDGSKILSASQMFPKQEVLVKETRGLEISLGHLIDAAEGKGKIRLTLLRPVNGQTNLQDIEFGIPKIGSFGQQFDPEGDKARNYAAILAHRIAVQQQPDGSWNGAYSYATNAFYSSMCGLGLLSTGESRYEPNIQAAAHFVAYQAKRDDWCYNWGTCLTFLAEYYLRTQDHKILDGLNEMIRTVEGNLLQDYTMGHKFHSPGYGGSGWIGGGGVVALGLAVSSHTKAKTDRELLKKILDRIYQLAPNGKMPYGRSGQSRAAKHFAQPARGQGWSAGNGPYYLASRVGGGARGFIDAAGFRYSNAPFGDADAGHASHALPFVWASLCSAYHGNKAHRENLNVFLWRLTTHRDYNGFINRNTNRLEYHGGDGVIGGPYWNTGGYLLILNAHKKNMAITGQKKYRGKPRNVELVADQQLAFYRYTRRNWMIVQAALGKDTPGAVSAGINKLNNMKADLNLGKNVYRFLHSKTPSVFKQLLRSKIKSPLKEQCIELIAGVSHDLRVLPQGKWADFVKDKQKMECQVMLTSHSPYSQWKQSLDKEFQEVNAVPFLETSGTITLQFAKNGNHKKINFASNSKAGQPFTINVPARWLVQVGYTMDYRIGDLPIKYKNLVWIEVRDDLRGQMTKLQRLWIKGKANNDFTTYCKMLQLPDGDLLPTRSRNNEISQVIIDNSTFESAQEANWKAQPNQWYEFLISPGDRWSSHLHAIRMKR